MFKIISFAYFFFQQGFVYLKKKRNICVDEQHRLDLYEASKSIL